VPCRFCFGNLCPSLCWLQRLFADNRHYRYGAKFGTSFTKRMSGVVFSDGLMLVVIEGAELFTGDRLMVSSVRPRDNSWHDDQAMWPGFRRQFFGWLLVTMIFSA